MRDKITFQDNCRA